MILFDLNGFIERLSARVNSFLSVYGSNPIVWVLIFAVILAISFYGISNLSNK